MDASKKTTIIKKKAAPMQDYMKYTPLSPPPFTTFTPLPGVTFSCEGKTKMGPRLEDPSSNPLTLDSLTLDNSIRMTRKNYMILTRGGNLSRSRQQEKEMTLAIPRREKKEGFASEPNLANSLLNSSKALAKKLPETARKNDDDSVFDISEKLAKEKKIMLEKMRKNTEIKINSNKFFEFTQDILKTDRTLILFFFLLFFCFFVCLCFLIC